MTLEIIIQILLLGLALSMDAFAVSITSGLTYKDISKKQTLFIAFLFGFMQALMPLIGYFIVEIVEVIVGASASSSAGAIMSDIVSWVAFSLLIFIGLKMLIEGIKELNKKEEEKEEKKFSLKEVIYLGFATSIDALGSGVALHSSISTNVTIWLHVSIIMVITFSLSLVGLILGNKIVKLLKGKYEIAEIVGGIILLGLAVWIIVEHYM
ncbi:MAG: manganese efflux pump [Bacilli bacterium]|nr:manganese efflux pump [Bacilli bacterium]